jgi:hypothetical protein
VTINERADPETRRELLARTYADADGVRRLDQQLIYAPLGAAAAAVYAVAANRAEFQAIQIAPWVWPVYGIVVLLVGAGLVRNHWRHAEILRRRVRLLRMLGVDERLNLDAAFAVGRPIYLALFGVGFSVAMAALVRLLAPT